METKRMVYKVLEEKHLDSDGPGTKLEDILAWFDYVRNKYPNFTSYALSAYQGYDLDDYSLCITGVGEETDDEFNFRLRERARYEALEGKREREQYEKLKQKYGPK